MSKTGIEWTDFTWNPTRGCSRVSDGCRNCYAERVAGRFSGPGQPYEGFVTTSSRHPQTGMPTVGVRPHWTGAVRLVPERLADPLSWRTPRRIFVNSMSDLFHEKLSDADIDKVFSVMLLAPRHQFQVLTKRPERVRAYLSDPGLYDRVLRVAGELRRDRPELSMVAISNPATFPASWIWWGVSVEDQATADERIPILLQTPAAIRFVSYEPALGPVDVDRWIWGQWCPDSQCSDSTWDHHCQLGEQRLHWVIAGSESGPGARPAELDWFRSVRDQCAAAGVAFFFKQWVGPEGVGITGPYRIGRRTSVPQLDGRSHVEFPR